MKRFIDVHAGEVMAGSGEVVLKSDAQRSCVVIAAYDSAQKIGGLAQAFFSHAITHNRISMILDTASAIDKMIEDMSLLGAHRDDIEVCLVTADEKNAQALKDSQPQDIVSTLDLLRERHLKIRENSTLESGHHHVELDVNSGCVSCK